MFQSSVYFPLGGIVAQVGHQTYTEGVCALSTLYDAQVACCLSQTLPEAQAVVVLSKSMSLKVPCQESQVSQQVSTVTNMLFSISDYCTVLLIIQNQTKGLVTFATRGVKHLQMVYSHLQNFSFFQFS